jgi:hypothetical protein
MLFTAVEIAFLFAPEHEHPVLAGWLPSAPVAFDRKLINPLILDPTWPDDRLFAAFTQYLRTAR